MQTAYVGKGPSDKLSVEQVAKAQLEFPTDLLVQVKAAATNPVDTKSVQ